MGMRDFFKRHGWWLCPVTIAWKAIDEIWSIPGRISDTETWKRWIEKGNMWPVDVSDWVLIALFLIGAIAWVWDRRERKKPTPAPTDERAETWPTVEDRAAGELTPFKIACWLDRRKPQWPLPSSESREYYDDIIDALTAESRFGNELPLGRQSPPWAQPWGAQVYWQRGVGEKGDLNKEHEIELTRSLVRRYLRATDHPIPDFLEEKYDDRFPWK